MPRAIIVARRTGIVVLGKERIERARRLRLRYDGIEILVPVILNAQRIFMQDRVIVESLCSVRSGNLASPRAGVYPGAGRSVILVIHESVQTNMENQYAERPG